MSSCYLQCGKNMVWLSLRPPFSRHGRDFSRKQAFGTEASESRVSFFVSDAKHLLMPATCGLTANICCFTPTLFTHKLLLVFVVFTARAWCLLKTCEQVASLLHNQSLVLVQEKARINKPRIHPRSSWEVALQIQRKTFVPMSRSTLRVFRSTC